MLKELRQLILQYQDRSERLDELDRILNHSWKVVTEVETSISYIFSTGGELMVSKSGNVTFGTYRVLPQANSLLLCYGETKALYKQRFIDPALMVLQKDGTDDGYAVLANETLIPDGDVLGYVERMYVAPAREAADEKLRVQTQKESAEINKSSVLLRRIGSRELRAHYAINPPIGKAIIEGRRITIDLAPAPDDLYVLPDVNESFTTVDGVVSEVFLLKKYKLSYDDTLIIRHNYRSMVGGQAELNNQPAPDGKYKVGFLHSITVKDGLVV